VMCARGNLSTLWKLQQVPQRMARL